MVFNKLPHRLVTFLISRHDIWVLINVIAVAHNALDTGYTTSNAAYLLRRLSRYRHFGQCISSRVSHIHGRCVDLCHVFLHCTPDVSTHIIAPCMGFCTIIGRRNEGVCSWLRVRLACWGVFVSRCRLVRCRRRRSRRGVATCGHGNT